MTPNPLLERLGYPPDARLVIFHADDVGMCHGSNRAFLELLEAGIVKCGSVMVPCPWAPEILRHAAQHPEVDLGVHLTLTSEWDGYRWGPISTRQANSGLLDAEGYFWPSVPEVAAHLNVTAAVREMEAQMERTRAFGVDVTHVDNHMGVILIPGLTHAYFQLALEHRMPLLAFRQLDDHVRAGVLASADATELLRGAAALESQGVPLVDWFRITPDDPPDASFEGRAAQYEAILRGLRPGVTYFSLHPNTPGDIEIIGPDWAGKRVFEYEYFRSERLRAFLAAEGITPIGFRAIRNVMRAP